MPRHPHHDRPSRRPIRHRLRLGGSLLALLIIAIPPPIVRGKEVRGPITSVEVVILSTMLTDRAGVGEWGFSALVEADGRRILFDTGARPETVLKNARELKIDLSGVTDVILSHHHADN